MNRIRTVLLLPALLGAIAWMGGCSKTTSPTDDSSFILSRMDDASMSDVTTGQVRDEMDAVAAKAESNDSLLPRDGIRFRRHIEQFTRTVTTTMHDADGVTHFQKWAEASMLFRASGTLRVWLPGHDSSYITKAFADSGVRMMTFEGQGMHRHMMDWNGMTTTPIVFSSGADAPAVSAVRIQQPTEGIDINITDPTVQYNLASLPKFNRSADVIVTVTATPGATVVGHKKGGRALFTETTPGTYTLTYRPEYDARRMHFTVDVLNAACVSDSTTPYGASGWGFPHGHKM